MDTSSERNSSASLDSNLIFFIFGKSSSFSFDEVVQLVILIVDQIEPDSFIEQCLLTVIVGEERLDKVVVESGDGVYRFMVVEVILQSGVLLLEFNTEGMEQFSVGEGRIDITNHDDVTSMVEVRYNILYF